MDAEILRALTAAEAGRRMRPTSPMLEELTAEKGLPQNLEAERSVLGAILLEPSALASVFPILKEDDFFPDTHRRIYRSMSDLAQRSAEIDVLTLREELATLGFGTPPLTAPAAPQLAPAPEVAHDAPRSVG